MIMTYVIRIFFVGQVSNCRTRASEKGIQEVGPADRTVGAGQGETGHHTTDPFTMLGWTWVPIKKNIVKLNLIKFL